VILGLLSDSHGQVERTAAAVRLLQHVGAEAFVHCGDVGGIEVLQELAGLRAWVVCGNTDCPDATLVRHAQSLGVAVTHEGPLRLELDGRSLAAFHGHEPAFVRLIGALSNHRTPPADFGPCQYVLHGHTHVPCAERVGAVQIINPGALYRAIVHTVATLDLRAGKVQFWEVSDNPADTTPREFFPDE
jgi:uncharacterized protein